MVHDPEMARASLIEVFGNIQDPRLNRKKRHDLVDIMVITICAVICGAEHWTEVEDFGHCKIRWFSSFLELPNGIPSHDTFRRVFSVLDPERLQEAYADWVKGFMRDVDVEHFCLDGKTVRGSEHLSEGKRAIHMLSVYSHECGLVVTQSKVDAKSNEITAIPEILRRLELQGAIVTIDAMGCQTGIASQITGQGGDYVLMLKSNQTSLHSAVKHHFQCAEREGFELLDHDSHETLESGHGRVESRHYDVIGDAGWLDAGHKWGGLAAVGRVVSERGGSKSEAVSVETRYYLLSRRLSAEEFASTVRSHWSIENSLHWILDVAFREDECQLRAGFSAENFAVLRHIALGLLKQGTRIKRGIKTRRKVAGWDENYLLELIKGNFNA